MTAEEVDALRDDPNEEKVFCKLSVEDTYSSTAEFDFVQTYSSTIINKKDIAIYQELEEKGCDYSFV